MLHIILLIARAYADALSVATGAFPATGDLDGPTSSRPYNRLAASLEHRAEGAP